MEPKSTKSGKVIYTKVWEFPVRLVHWLLFLSIVVLGITGYEIGNPSFSSTKEASDVYMFAKMRFWHFVAGYVLLAAFLIRLYWGFAGNRFARWTTMLPITKKRWKGIFSEIVALFLPRKGFGVYTGHSPLANVSYIILYLAVFFAILTGFTMYSHALYTPFRRTVAIGGLALFGNNLNFVHLIHHLLLWFFALFLIIHLYLAVYTLLVTKSTEVDTIISGNKFVFEHELSAENE